MQIYVHFVIGHKWHFGQGVTDSLYFTLGQCCSTRYLKTNRDPLTNQEQFHTVQVSRTHKLHLHVVFNNSENLAFHHSVVLADLP